MREVRLNKTRFEQFLNGEVDSFDRERCVSSLTQLVNISNGLAQSTTLRDKENLNLVVQLVYPFMLGEHNINQITMKVNHVYIIDGGKLVVGSSDIELNLALLYEDLYDVISKYHDLSVED